MDTRFNRSVQNDYSCFVENVSVLNPRGRPLERKKQVEFNVKKRKRASRISLDKKELVQAHRYVLFNSNNVDHFRK